MNEWTYKRKDKSYIPLGINAGYINYTNSLFLLTFPGSVAYLKLMKPKGFGELCAVTSDLANRTGIEKNRSFDHPQAELDILSFQKHLNGPEIVLVRAFMLVLFTSNFDDDSIKNESASMETPFSHYKSIGNFLDPKGS